MQRDKGGAIWLHFSATVPEVLVLVPETLRYDTSQDLIR